MKKFFFPLFVGCQLVFIVLYIHKSSTWMGQSYRKQQLEQSYKTALEKKQHLTHQLHMAKNQSVIKQCATNAGMTPIKISQVKSLQCHE